MDYSKIITIEDGKMGGKPCIRGLRITVSDVLDYMASGMSHEEISNIVDCNTGTVRSRLFYARQQLQAYLSDYLKSP